MKTIEQYFIVLLLILLYRVFLTFCSVEKIFKGDHLNKGYRAALSCGDVDQLINSILGWVLILSP